MLSIGDFLYSEKNDQFQEYVDDIKRLRRLKSEPESFWVEILCRFIIDKKVIVVVGDPSAEEMKRTGEEEKERVRKQAEDLGENGLKGKQESLEKAIAENEASFSLFLIL